MKRICAICGDTIIIDENNADKAIKYKNKFYHFKCFNNLCNEKMANKRSNVVANWTTIKNSIDELVEATTKEQKLLVCKDNLYQWLFRQYRISFLSAWMYTKFDEIYNGTFKGLAYAIDPIELFDEWQYYWNELCSIRKNKGIVGEGAINYDLAVLLGKNAEYREIKEKERVAMEIIKQQEIEEVKIDVEVTSLLMRNTQRKNAGERRASLFEEVMGNGE